MSDITVEELIKELEKYPKDMKVRTTQGGSGNFEMIDYISEEISYEDDEDDETILVIGQLSW